MNIADSLGRKVQTPAGIMILCEIYSNGNCACIPINCLDYHRELKEFHQSSILMCTDDTGTNPQS